MYTSLQSLGFSTVFQEVIQRKLPSSEYCVESWSWLNVRVPKSFAFANLNYNDKICVNVKIIQHCKLNYKLCSDFKYDDRYLLSLQINSIWNVWVKEQSPHMHNIL